MALAAQLGMHLAGTIDAVVGAMDLLDQVRRSSVGDRPGRGRAGDGRVVRRRGDLQHPVDRLDPELLPVGLDVVDDHLCGRSSSAAKKADALRKIAFARRSSRTSRSNSANR